jgi:hypothetical protein
MQTIHGAVGRGSLEVVKDVMSRSSRYEFFVENPTASELHTRYMLLNNFSDTPIFHHAKRGFQAVCGVTAGMTVNRNKKWPTILWHESHFR